MKVTRSIEVYDNQTEELIDEVVLKAFNLNRMRDYFNVDQDDPYMYSQCEINNLTASIFLDIKFNFEKNSYFLACYQTE